MKIKRHYANDFARSGAFGDNVGAANGVDGGPPGLRMRMMLLREFRRQSAAGDGLVPCWTSSQMRVPCVSFSSRLPTTRVIAATPIG